ncbi:MAG: sulfatase-like hydrolase/transferase, partial [Planctomycetes bacterium]|nr:sulfatase-like hydrolase/transferase [Planctomycetota bacterium]
DAAGAADQTPVPCDGISLIPAIRDPNSELPARALFSHYPHYHHSRPAGAVHEGDWKLIEFFGDDAGGGSFELYNLRNDIGESRHLIDRKPDKARKLQDKLKAWRESVDARLPRKNPGYQPDRAEEWWDRQQNKPLDREAMDRNYRSPVADQYRAHPRRSDAGKRPNVVFILSDDQAWTDYGFMGHPHIQTPRLDRLARESLVFPRGYVTSSLCCPSLATMMTGLYPHQHLIMGNDPALPPGIKGLDAALRDPTFLAKSDEIDDNIERVAALPRVLAEQGYLSLQTGKWWHGSYLRGGFTHGMTHGDPKRGGRHGDAGLAIGREGLKPIRDFLELAQQQEKPFLVWYAPMLPHEPHNPPDRLLERYRDQTDSVHIAIYWAMCEWFDETCGQLLDLLAEMNVVKDTIVLYIADNGWIQLPDRNGFATESKRSPYDGGVRTPIMVRWPGRIQPARSERLAGSIDLAPTILKACGLEPTASMDGVNLLDTEAVASRDCIFGEIYAHDEVDLHRPAPNLRCRWCIENHWKLIVPFLPNLPDEQVELFDLSNDPHEENNLAVKQPNIVEKLRQRLDAHWRPEVE